MRRLLRRTSDGKRKNIMLTVSDLSFSYGEVQVLRGVDVHVPAETIVSMMGRNGVGKTTLMNNIVGLLKPSSGSIQIEEQELAGVATHRRIRAGLAYVPQGRMIFPKLTVEENLTSRTRGAGGQTDADP